MKVLDLQCAHQHRFEGWFGSEDDFRHQLADGLLQCPACGDVTIAKRLSAPRLNLGSAREPEAPTRTAPVEQADATAELSAHAAWLAMARRMVANTDDVGRSFAEEARRMHYGEIEHRAIRGEATVGEAVDMIEEGIEIVPLPAALFSKQTLQ
ncbi:DUF1178 family protein [Rhodoferax sp.]|uniref:DUF1178 family protein n=1 Tax=Rhodoferax sp. TaxID=50421 RepID=UPI0027614812|nr:DUF1178 family protein [Rhodoferax sp.]